MFAPPPVPLSRAEIEDRLWQEKKPEGTATAMEISNPTLDGKPASLRQKASSSPRWNPNFGSTDKSSSPIGARARPPDWDLVNATHEGFYALSPGFGEHPRQAPTPPKRPAPSLPKDAWLPPLPGSFPDLETSVAEALRMTEIASPTQAANTPSPSLDQAAMPSPGGRMKSGRSVEGTGTGANVARTRGGGSVDRTAMVKGARIEKSSVNRRSIYSSASNDQHVLDRFRTIYGADGSGAAADGDEAISPATRSPRSFKQYLPSRLQFITRDLPDTPTSFGLSPTEVCQASGGGSPSSIASSPRSKRRRSPLAQLSAVNAKNNGSPLAEMDISPSRLSAIPEYTSMCDKSPLSSEGSTPISTRIHLRGGSVLTLNPPELTPWQQSVYIQGPIQLPTPIVLPRTNSVASLEPFQDALEIPRRRSEDQVLDEICEFFKGFGFRYLALDGDGPKTTEPRPDERMETGDDERERIASPPVDAGISTLGRSVDQEATEAVLKPPPSMVKQSIPPVDNEARLRARGIASLAQRTARGKSHMRDDSATIPDTLITPIMPVGAGEGERGDPSKAEQLDQGIGSTEDGEAAASVGGLAARPAARAPVMELRRLVAAATGFSGYAAK